MLIGVLPALKDDNGEWRFTLMTHEDDASRGEFIFGYEPGEESGMLEPRCRAVLAEAFKLAPADVERVIRQAKGLPTN